MIQFLTTPRTLWLLFWLFLIETITFGAVMLIWDFAIIDEMSDPDQIRDHIAAMSQAQRMVHAWMTATLDVAYPLTYGALFVGLSLRRLRPIFAVPAFAVVPADLLEGWTQIMVLTGDDSTLWLKAYVTPIKLFLFVLAILIAILALSLDVRERRNADN